MKHAAIKILIVDGRPMIRAGMRAMLKASDIRVVGEAGTPDETLRLLEARRPDLVLLNDRIPGTDELDLLRRIKEKWPKVSVIIVTANESPYYLSRAIALGCSGYLLDWVTRGEFLKAVRAVARGECVVEPPVLQKLLKDMGRQQAEREAKPEAEFTFSEREVLRLISEGQTNRQIARRLGYSVGTVKDYVHKIIHELHVSDRTQAAVKATHLGLLD